MADVTIRVTWNNEALRRLATSRDGPVVRDMMRRGYRVQKTAQQLLKERGRVDHGRLLGSISVVPVISSNVAIVRVGTNLEYAMWVEVGTGIYGPRGARIYPKTKKALAFTPRKTYGGSFIKTKNRTLVIVRSIKGMPGIHYMRDALHSAVL